MVPPSLISCYPLQLLFLRVFASSTLSYIHCVPLIDCCGLLVILFIQGGSLIDCSPPSLKSRHHRLSLHSLSITSYKSFPRRHLNDESLQDAFSNFFHYHCHDGSSGAGRASCVIIKSAHEAFFQGALKGPPETLPSRSCGSSLQQIRLGHYHMGSRTPMEGYPPFIICCLVLCIFHCATSLWIFLSRRIIFGPNCIQLRASSKRFIIRTYRIQRCSNTKWFIVWTHCIKFLRLPKRLVIRAERI